MIVLVLNLHKIFYWKRYRYIPTLNKVKLLKRIYYQINFVLRRKCFRDTITMQIIIANVRYAARSSLVRKSKYLSYMDLKFVIFCYLLKMRFYDSKKEKSVISDTSNKMRGSDRSRHMIECAVG